MNANIGSCHPRCLFRSLPAKGARPTATAPRSYASAGAMALSSSTSVAKARVAAIDGVANDAPAKAVTRRLQKVKRTLVEEAGGCCAVCGYDRCIVNLQFHHVDPSTKSFALSVASGKGLAKLRAEAAKCVLVCANCHGEIESGLVESPPPGAIYRRA
jgi:hypothetical protein